MHANVGTFVYLRLSIRFHDPWCTTPLTGVFTSAGVPLVAATSTLIVALSTYCVANILKSLRRTSFLNKATREIIADFAPTLGVATGTLAALWGKSR